MLTTQALKIAVADDEPRMRDYYREILARLGHRVISSSPTSRCPNSTGSRWPSS